MLPAAQLVIEAVVPLNVTEPVPCEDPKFDPETVTAVPTGPEVTDRLAMLGAGATVKLTPLLFTPLALTTTFPVVAPEGTDVLMLPALQVVIAAVTPANFTDPVP